MSEFILETEGLTRHFSGFVAVNGVNLKVRRGSIHALIGPNGAGKTTCFNLLTKFLTPSSGRIRFDGTDITGLSPAQVARRGMVRSFQISATFPHLTVLENVRLALQRKRGSSFDFWRSGASLEKYHKPAQDLLESVGLKDFMSWRAALLPYGRKRALELATTLALDPQILLLDEPTAGMAREEIGRIIDLIRATKGDRTILMVEHNLSVVKGLSDMITVLARGSVIAEGPYSEVSQDPSVVSAYLGKAHA